jgi:hypothetical protein
MCPEQIDAGKDGKHVDTLSAEEYIDCELA